MSLTPLMRCGSESRAGCVMPYRGGSHSYTNPASLSHTELCVLRSFAEGYSRVEIARRLGISNRTVGHALTNAKEKLGARSLAHAAVVLKRAEDYDPSRLDGEALRDGP
jgi:DNA-binding CsgD family transcriptional regulator